MQNFLRNQKFHMYLYILEAFNIPDKDLLSKSDPYLIIKLGDKVLNVKIKFNFSFKKNTSKMMIIHSSTRKFIKWSYYRKMQCFKLKFGTMIQFWEMISLVRQWLTCKIELSSNKAIFCLIVLLKRINWWLNSQKSPRDR